MQSQNEDRRAPRVRRIELETLVEICGKDADVPAFEARTIEISGRGMQVKTRYLPELHTPLVLRFERAGHEVLVEGEVAWRKPGKSGGQFGVKFTALDSKSVSALKALCATPQAAQAEPAEAADDAHEAATNQAYLSERGAAVKLHIQGLGAPMKARVRKGTPRKIQVGSQLEFLKVGRSLELEDVTAGERREAHIDSVTVAIEPETQIPQLVVSLRYEGVEDDTPEPTVVSQADDHAEDDEAYDDEFDEEYDEEITEDLFKGKVGAMAANAGRAVRDTSANMARWGSETLRGVGSLLQRSASKASSGVSKSGPPRRTSHVPKTTSSLRRAQRPERSEVRGQHQLRSSKRRVAQPAPSRRPKLWMYAGALVLGASGVYALTHESSPSVAMQDPLLQAPAGYPAPGAAVAPGAVAPTALPQAAQPASLPAAAPQPTGPFPPRAALSVAEQQEADTQGIVAQVPLFGAKTMATVEEAPPNPAPVAQVDEYSLAKDQSFDDRVVTAPQPAAEAEQAEGTTQFQVGRMHLPVIHRLRLDGAGATLQGSKTDTGFAVLIPGRKVMENGASIASRDDRIVNVRVNNTPAGGKVTFRFRKDIPGYKARLRKDYVEFFINSPAKK